MATIVAITKDIITATIIKDMFQHIRIIEITRRAITGITTKITEKNTIRTSSAILAIRAIMAGGDKRLVP